jgi:hypothetical protein
VPDDLYEEPGRKFPRRNWLTGPGRRLSRLETEHPSECAAYPAIVARGLSRGLRCAVALVSIVVWSKVETGAVDGEASIIVL